MDNTPLSPFQCALIDSVLEEYNITLASCNPITPSSEFKQWLQTNVATACQRAKLGRIVKGILIAAILVALLTISVMAAPAIRDAFVHFFLLELPDHYTVTFDPAQAATAPQEIIEQYKISSNPSGFERVAENQSPSSYVVLWISEQGQYIQYSQRLISKDAQSDTWIGIDYAGDPQIRIIENFAINIIPGKETNIWVWTNNAYIFTLEMPIDFPDEFATELFCEWLTPQSGTAEAE